MPSTLTRNTAILTALLILAAITQAAYTALYLSGGEVPRQWLWGSEGAIFTLVAAFAGAAMLEARRDYLGWAAIFAAAVLNVVQVGVGLTLFAPFGAAATALPDLAPVASGIVAFSFMVYNAAKALLGLAAIVFGMARMNEGPKALGAAAALVGAVALLSNLASVLLGRDFLGEIPLAGGSGVLATVLLAACLPGAVRVVRESERGPA